MVNKFVSKILIGFAKFYKFFKSTEPYASAVFVTGMFVTIILTVLVYIVILALTRFRQLYSIEIIFILCFTVGIWLYFGIKNRNKKRLFHHYRNYKKDKGV
jgi:uncharacterized membrane protein YqjE